MSSAGSKRRPTSRKCLSLVDQQEQLRDCSEARAGLPKPDRIAAVCATSGSQPSARTTSAAS